MNNLDNRGQSEMVGFILIVVIVMVGLMVFLVLSLNSPSAERESVQVERLLSSLMEHTTECAIVFEPQFDSIKDLIKSCYDNEKCLDGQMACDYLNETLADIMNDVVQTEASVSAYTLIVGEEESDEMVRIDGGACGGSLVGAQQAISVNSGKILVRLNFCY